MSYLVGAEPARTDADRLRAAQTQTTQNGGQSHDRISVAQQDTKPGLGSGSNEITIIQRMVSASTGSFLTSLLVTPLDVVRVRLQSQSLPTPHNLSRFHAYSSSFKQLPPDLGLTACCKDIFWVNNNAEFCLVAGNGATPATTAVAECVADETQRKHFTSTYDGIKKIARNEGTLTLWRGLTPTLVMAVPGNVIYFTGYDWLRYNPQSPIKMVSNDTYAPLAAGSVARVAAAVAVSPIEMFRTRMQATAGANGVFRETLTGLHRMTQTQGYTSLWRGLTLTMWRDVPFSGIYWWSYERLRNIMTDARQSARGLHHDSDLTTADRRHTESTEAHSATFLDSFTAGAAAGALASVITTPFDVGKTRQQVYRHAGDDVAPASSSIGVKGLAARAGSLVPEEMSMPRFLYHIFQEEGPSGLFKGWAARCLKVAPACAIMISSYEIGKKWAREINEKKGQHETASHV